MFTIDAIINPTRPIIKKEPIGDRSLLVEYPYILKAENDTAVIKKTLTIEAPVYTNKIEDKDTPITAAKVKNKPLAVVASILLTLADNQKTIPNGANITTHLSGLP